MGAPYNLIGYVQLVGLIVFVLAWKLWQGAGARRLAKGQLARPKSLRKRAWLVTRLLRLVFSIGVRLQIFVHVDKTGQEHVPATGPVLICPNHISASDPVFVFGVLRRDVAFLAKAELFRNPILKRLLLGMGHIPVTRGTNAAVEAAKLGERVLDQGGAVVMFPEGTCAVDEYLLPAKSGMAHMAFRTGAPVVPVGLVGTDQVKPLRGRVRLGRSVEINFGRPISPPYQSDNACLADRETFTAEVMTEIARLSRRKLPESAK